MEPINIIIIAIIYFIATFYGSLIGGGGLLTIPALIFFGLSPHAAIGTNKIGALGLSTGASLGYGTEKKIDYKFGFVFMIFLVIGSFFGSLSVLSIPEHIIKNFIGIIMIIIALTLLFKKDFGTKIIKKKKSIIFLIIFALASGFYNGFYGAGIGTINRIILTVFFAYTLIGSAALSAFSNILSNLLALVVFTVAGVVQYSLFIPIILASFLGAYLGSKYGVKLGNDNIKRLLLIITIIMAIKLLIF